MNEYPRIKWDIQQYASHQYTGFKEKALQWASAFPLCVYLDSNDYDKDQFRRYDALIAVGDEPTLQAQPGLSSFTQIEQWHQQHSSWLFGYLGYDSKNEIEALASNNHDALQWPDMLFFHPKTVIEITGEELTIHSRSHAPSVIARQILEMTVTPVGDIPKPNIRSRMSKADYLRSVEAIRQHIIAGDIYEMNFCQEFFAKEYQVDPLALFRRLNEVAKAPFAAYMRWGDAHLCCASPERFMQKKANQLISQPIKGTIARGATAVEDLELQQQLYDSMKDRAENVMIVDLVRNDLARSCQPGSIKVNELFGIYPFAQVSHMISTVQGILRDEVHFTKAIKNAFPMGSMTGAPKIMSMVLIEQYEQSRRGLYSGSVGYITPERDFDFNVVIRSILLDVARACLSFQVGGAIVYDSVPEREYDECLLKAKGMLEVLGYGLIE